MSTMLAAVKALAEHGISMHCDFCTGSTLSGHLDGCPLLAMPRIVALVRAVERLEAVGISATPAGGCGVCGEYPEDEHAPDCQYQALVAALGDVGG